MLITLADPSDLYNAYNQWSSPFTHISGALTPLQNAERGFMVGPNPTKEFFNCVEIYILTKTKMSEYEVFATIPKAGGGYRRIFNGRVSKIYANFPGDSTLRVLDLVIDTKDFRSTLPAEYLPALDNFLKFYRET
jgi:hypothetical protein